MLSFNEESLLAALGLRIEESITANKRMQPDFGELALPSAADARR